MSIRETDGTLRLSIMRVWQVKLCCPSAKLLISTVHSDAIGKACKFFQMFHESRNDGTVDCLGISQALQKLRINLSGYQSN